MSRDSRIRVLHVLEDLGTAGTERQVAAFLVRSDLTRFHHEVCVLSYAGPFAARLQDAGVPVHQLGLAPDGGMARCFARLLRLVRQVEPDLLHASLYRPGVVSRAVAKICGKPAVTTLVNTTYEPERLLDNPHLKPWKIWATRTVDRFTARLWGTAFVAVTESVKDSAIRQLGIPSAKISVISRGLSFDGWGKSQEEHAGEAKAALGWADAYPLILNVGRLVPQKGQLYAIRAMHTIVSKFPSARLLIAGEGWLRSALEQLIRTEGLENHVALLGERQDIDVLLLAADMFLFPSLYEGAANALVEAMAVGKPCVVNDIPSLREITVDGTVALLAGFRSPEGLAEKVLWLAEDRERARRLGEAARDWARSRYDIRTSVAALESLYWDLAGSRRARARGMRAT